MKNSLTLRDVHSLPGEARRSLETLLERPLEEGERLFIMSFRPGEVPSESARQQAHAQLRSLLGEAHRHAERLGVDAGEADAAVAEAMRQVRPDRP